MITLITGTPGSSKTLNTIDLVLNDPAYQDRPVYTYNIELLEPAHALGWTALTEEQAQTWYDLPKGAVVILDECQDLFPPEKFGNKVPEHVRRLNTHRHLGVDLILVTQHPKLIDTKVRRLVGLHYHFKRQFGLQSATRFTFQECAENPNDYFTQKGATKTRKRFNKKLYGFYKSAEVHTHKRKIPWLIWGLLALIVVVVVTLYSVVSNFGQSENATTAPPPRTPATDQPIRSAPRSIEGGPITREQYLEKWSPRIPGIPHSAPAYDEVYQVKDFPRPQCVMSQKKGCHCYTQQATPLDVPNKECRQIVAHGYWDPTKAPAGSQDVASTDGEGQGQQKANANERLMRALQIRAQIETLRY